MDGQNGAAFTADGVSLRTLQRRARAAGQGRFAWNDQRDKLLSDLWLTATPEALCALIGCKERSLYKRAAELSLAPRDPVQRAIKIGEQPRDPLRLPTYDEMRANAGCIPAFAAPLRPETARFGRSNVSEHAS